VLRTFADRKVDGRPWRYLKPSGEPRRLSGKWEVEFIEGGPKRPRSFDTRTLESWTALADSEAHRFAGTARYTLTFDAPENTADDWLLDLGRVCESARVRLNGDSIGTLWYPPFQVPLRECLKSGRNTLEIEVTNLAANRIADLDRRRVEWKIFHDINIVNLDYKPLDATNWAPRDSGLLGPLQLIPMDELRP